MEKDIIEVNYTPLGHIIIISKRVEDEILKRAKAGFDKISECCETVEVQLYTPDGEAIDVEVKIQLNSRVVFPATYYTPEDRKIETWCEISKLEIFDRDGQDRLHYVYGEADRTYTINDYQI